MEFDQDNCLYLFVSTSYTITYQENVVLMSFSFKLDGLHVAESYNALFSKLEFTSPEPVWHGMLKLKRLDFDPRDMVCGHQARQAGCLQFYRFLPTIRLQQTPHYVPVR